MQNLPTAKNLRSYILLKVRNHKVFPIGTKLASVWSNMPNDV